MRRHPFRTGVAAVLAVVALMWFSSAQAGAARSDIRVIADLVEGRVSATGGVFTSEGRPLTGVRVSAQPDGRLHATPSRDAAGTGQLAFDQPTDAGRHQLFVAFTDQSSASHASTPSNGTPPVQTGGGGSSGPASGASPSPSGRTSSSSASGSTPPGESPSASASASASKQPSGQPSGSASGSASPSPSPTPTPVTCISGAFEDWTLFPGQAIAYSGRLEIGGEPATDAEVTISSSQVAGSGSSSVTTNNGRFIAVLPIPTDQPPGSVTVRISYGDDLSCAEVSARVRIVLRPTSSPTEPTAPAQASSAAGSTTPTVWRPPADSVAASSAALPAAFSGPPISRAAIGIWVVTVGALGLLGLLGLLALHSREAAEAADDVIEHAPRRRRH